VGGGGVVLGGLLVSGGGVVWGRGAEQEERNEKGINNYRWGQSPKGSPALIIAAR